MGVRIKLSREFQDCTGDRETVEVKGNTVKECLLNLVSLFPGLKGLLFDSGDALSAVIVLDGEALVTKDLNRPVEDRHELIILPLIYGG